MQIHHSTMNWICLPSIINAVFIVVLVYIPSHEQEAHWASHSPMPGNTVTESDTRAFGKNRKVNSDNGSKKGIIPIGIDIKGKGIFFSMRSEHLLNIDE